MAAAVEEDWESAVGTLSIVSGCLALRVREKWSERAFWVAD